MALGTGQTEHTVGCARHAEILSFVCQALKTPSCHVPAEAYLWDSWRKYRLSSKSFALVNDGVRLGEQCLAHSRHLLYL